jgi:hypothetical protein
MSQRPSSARTSIRTSGNGEDYFSDAETVPDVDKAVRSALRNGDIPDYIAKDPWWGGKVIINENGHTLEVLVAPDYGAVGRSHPIRIGKESQFAAQDYVDAYNSIMPSQKLLRAIEAAASPKIPFIAVQKAGRADDSVAGMIKASELADAAFAKYGTSNDDGRLKIGYKKAYVVRPNMDGKYLAIYGGRWSTTGGLVQPTSGHAHTSDYSDYSHGIVLVSRKALLDGEDVDLRTDVFGSRDPSIYSLVSDEGRFDPVFPNAGGESVARFSMTEEAPESIPSTGSDVAIGKPAPLAGTPLAAIGAIGGRGTAPLAIGGAAGLATGLVLGLGGLPLVGVSVVGALVGRWWSTRKAA